MSKYNMVRTEMWTDDEVRILAPSGKLLYNYILSSPMSNIAGYYKLPISQIKNDLCRYDKETDEYNEEDNEMFKKEILPQLRHQAKLWKYDVETEQIFIPTYLKYNKVGGDRQLKAIDSAIKPLTICNLHIEFLYALLKYAGSGAWQKLDRDLVTEIILLAEEQTSEAAIYINNISI